MAKSRAAVRRPSGVLGDAALLKRLAEAFGFTPLPAGRETLSALTVRTATQCRLTIERCQAPGDLVTRH
ncbi:MAG TPA: hypothetical protein VH988_22115 [Thermoanaerobaculia bacterium]|jgi:hypothetical protein|nr:hypothetical protein [Thermoanaerobaculia bacterium]